MSEIHLIESTVAIAARRRRWQSAWLGLWQGSIVAGLALLLALGLYKFLPLPDWSLPAVGALASVALLTGFVIGWWRAPSILETARWMDTQTHSQERLSTALEISKNNSHGTWRALVLRDAAEHARQIDPRRLLAFHLPAASRWVLLVLALAAGLGFVPEYRTPEFIQKKKDAANIKAVARTLADVIKHQLDVRAPVMQPTQQALDAATNVAFQLSHANTTKSDAVRDLAKTVEKLTDQYKEQMQNPAVKRMESAARDPSSGADSSPGDVQKQMEALQSTLGKAASQSAAMEKLKDQLADLKKKFDALPDKNSAEGQAAQEQMAQTMADLASQAQELGLPTDSLDRAISELRAGNADMFLRDLKAEMADLDKLNALAKSLQQLQKENAQIGKDLAEQLKKGQATAAGETLKKMMEQLKAGNLLPEQLQQMMKEVKNAVKPAEDYGKAGDLLDQAAQQMQKGDKAGAAQSLADAGKELKKMLDQMNDAQELAATLEALKEAQMAVDNGQAWGQGANRNGKPRIGPGGKPGRGVGTWGEENAWLYYPEQPTENWDNTGVNRPDSDPKGHTERDINRPDNLASTKIHGQMAPGSAMPSIRLRGVHIKGESNVQFEDAAAAAQSEAQSALNNDQVPRTYRNSVRDYFDDLKK